MLVVDDDASITRLLVETLRPNFDAHGVTSVAEALEFIAQHEVAIVVADQRMPDGDGLELLGAVRNIQPTAVGVLITAHAEVGSAIQAINSARVLGFLTKPWDESELMLVLRRAMDAHYALRQLSRASRQPDRELETLQRLASNTPVPVTARGYGALSLREGLPDVFMELTDAYARALGMAIEQRSFKIEHRSSAVLHAIADRLGALGAGPRDVIDVHLAALRRRLSETAGREGSDVAEESRLLVLELMGHVVTYYRNHTLGSRG